MNILDFLNPANYNISGPKTSGFVPNPAAFAPKNGGATVIPKAQQATKQAQVAAATKAPTENTPKPIVTPPIVTNQPAATSTGSYQGGQEVPAVGSSAYNQAQQNAASVQSAQRAAMQQASQTPAGQLDPTNFNQNINKLYSASAPIDYNSTGINQTMGQYANIERQKAALQGAQMAFPLQQGAYATRQPTAGDFLGNNINFGSALLQAQSGALGAQETGIANTLQAQLALAQAQRTGGIEQASVPFSSANEPIATSPSNTFVNPYNPASIQAFNQGGIGSSVTRGANIQSLQTLIPQYQSMQANFAGIQNLQTGMQKLLGTSDLNPTSFPIVNQKIGSILKKGVGDPDYQALQNYINDLSTRYSSYFAGNGQVTNEVRDVSNSLINGNADPAAIAKVITSLNDQANAVMKGTYDQINSILQNPSGVNAPDTTGTSAQASSIDPLHIL